MKLLLLPFRLAAHLISLAFLLLTLAILAIGAYAAFNYLRPAPQVSIDNLAAGTVIVQSSNRIGTGAVIEKDGRWQVVTAAHVVADSKDVEITDRQGTRQRGTVRSLNPELDVAVIDVRREGDWVALVVQPDLPPPGQKVTTRCFFDAVPREGLFAGPVNDAHNGEEHVAQFDLPDLLAPLRGLAPMTSDSILVVLPAEPGCSGAPLLNASGQLIGIIVAGNERTTIAVTAGSAIAGN